MWPFTLPCSFCISVAISKLHRISRPPSENCPVSGSSMPKCKFSADATPRLAPTQAATGGGSLTRERCISTALFTFGDRNGSRRPREGPCRDSRCPLHRLPVRRNAAGSRCGPRSKSSCNPRSRAHAGAQRRQIRVHIFCRKLRRPQDATSRSRPLRATLA
jgi:hypothetical protein